MVIRGARQVGKSTLARQFAKENGLTLHEINLERYPKLTDVFVSHDTSRIPKELEYICQKGPALPPTRRARSKKSVYARFS